MAVTLTTPDHSFVQIGSGELDASCVPEIALCLPVYVLNDLSFQVIANVPKADEPWFEVEFEEASETRKHTIWGMICRDCENPLSEFSETSFSFTGTWTQIAEGGTGADTWLGNFTANGQEELFNLLEAGECFNICFYRVKVNVLDLTQVVGVTTTLIACTETCFNKITDPCFTSWFTYKCYENSFDFNYENSFVNQIRLPCYLSNMQLPSEELSYTKSSGAKIKLSERIEEEYDLNIDWMPKEWHKKLKVLLSHDYITINNINDGPVTNMAIVCREKYEINWPDIPWRTAPAKTKVIRSEALSLTNSNCN